MAVPESSRTFSLLSRLGLGDRIIGKGDTAELTAPIDWAAVEERLIQERQMSLTYLRCALGRPPLPAGGPPARRRSALCPDWRPHPLHRLHRLRQRLPQGRHHHGTGPGGLFLPGDRQRGLHPLRPLHRGLPHPAPAAGSLHAGGVRSLE